MEPPVLLALTLGTVAALAALPEGPLLSPPSHLLRGSPSNLSCSVPSGVAAANFTLSAGGRTLVSTLSPDGRQATATVTADREGRVRLGCSVRVSGVELRTEATVKVYDIPEPSLSITGSAAVAGAELRGLCSLPDGAAADTVLRVLSGQRVLSDWGRTPLPFGLSVPEEEDEDEDEEELELSCEAELMPWGHRRKTLRVPVLVPPRLDASSCPSQQNWTEGQEGTLRCRARGRPEPRVNCSKDSGNSLEDSGNSLEAGIPLPAALGHAGIYRCRARNELGTAERNVTVWVQRRLPVPVPLLPVLLGVLVPLLALLGLAGLALVLRHRTKIGEYRLWRRQPPPDARPLRPPGTARAATTAAPNGSAAP